MIKSCIKKATIKDIKFLFNLYNSSIIEGVSNTKKKIKFNSHKIWFYKNINSKLNKIFILFYGKLKIGYIRIEILKWKSCIISIYIKKIHRNKSLGSLYLNKIYKIIQNKEKINKIYAEVLKKNKSSQSFFLRNDFKLTKLKKKNVSSLNNKNLIYLKII